MRFLPQMSPDFVLRPADLWVFETSTGGLAHVECVRDVRKSLAPRMRFYREVITEAHPRVPLDQYVIVVGDGNLRAFDDPISTGDYFGLHLLHLSDVPPHWFGASPGFTFLGGCSDPPHFAQILMEVNLSLGRFLVSLQDDDRPDDKHHVTDGHNDQSDHNDTVLHDAGGKAQQEIPEQLLTLFFQGRFGNHPDISVESREEGWPIDVTVALAAYSITEYDNTRVRLASIPSVL